MTLADEVDDVAVAVLAAGDPLVLAGSPDCVPVAAGPRPISLGLMVVVNAEVVEGPTLEMVQVGEGAVPL